MTSHSSRRAPAMVDVARHAGVSHQTVSRVLNDHPYVTATTRERVLRAIAELGYRPNVAARALVTGRSRTVGLVTLDSTLYGPISTLYGIERAARSAGYYVAIVSLRTHEQESLADAITRLLAQSVAGIVVIAPLPTAFESLTALERDLPVVVVEGDPKAELAAVTVDQRSGARMATEHLLSLGHDTVHHLAGPRDWYEARERIAGWKEALRSAGRAVPKVSYGDWGARSGYVAGQTLLADGATAIFAANDVMALGVLRGLHERGLRAPEELSIVGFDDTAESAFFEPPLTTVRQDFAEVGRQCMQLLHEQLEAGTRSSSRTTISPELVVRDSSGPAPARERAAAGRRARRNQVP